LVIVLVSERIMGLSFQWCLSPCPPTLYPYVSPPQRYLAREGDAFENQLVSTEAELDSIVIKRNIQLNSCIQYALVRGGRSEEGGGEG
jgi:hypothetical protein